MIDKVLKIIDEHVAVHQTGIDNEDFKTSDTALEIVSELKMVRAEVEELTKIDNKSDPDVRTIAERLPDLSVLKLVSIADLLRLNGFDGVYAPDAYGECACLFSDLSPCGESCFECVPGYNRPDDPENTEKAEIYITPHKQ